MSGGRFDAKHRITVPKQKDDHHVEPDWDALGIPHLLDLPALQWKLKNIARMDTAKRGAALAKLEDPLGQ